MEQPANERRRKYDRWVTVPISAAAVSSSLIAFSVKGLVDKSTVYGSTKLTSLVDATSLIIGALVLVAMWVALWLSGRSGNRH